MKSMGSSFTSPGSHTGPIGDQRDAGAAVVDLPFPPLNSCPFLTETTGSWNSADLRSLRITSVR